MHCLITSAQKETVFKVKKPEEKKGKEYLRLYDYKLFPGVDTLASGALYGGDLRPIIGQYDSLAPFNLKTTLRGTRLLIQTPSMDCHAMLRFFKKEPDGSAKLVYIKNFIVITSKDWKQKYAIGK